MPRPRAPTPDSCPYLSRAGGMARHVDDPPARLPYSVVGRRHMTAREVPFLPPPGLTIPPNSGAFDHSSDNTATPQPVVTPYRCQRLSETLHSHQM
jgi:hypothetical protein